MLEDIVYFSTLAVSITLGGYYKNIDNFEVKKHYGTGVGMLIVSLICWHYLYHTILMVWLNAAILKFCDRRHVHLVSLAYTWVHLLYLHVNLSTAKYVIILHQNIALRLVGMAFEVYSVNNRSKVNLTMTSGEIASMTEITSVDVLSYAFCFIGLHKGPYYRYKMYVDHLKGTFGSLGDFRIITEHKLKKVFVCVVGYTLLRMKYSTQIYNSKTLYNYDTETRYLYNVPFLMMFVLDNVIVMLLCTCVCTEAGFGVYPARTMPLPGHGPSVNLSLLNMSPEEAMEQEYNFSMIKCYDKERLLMGPKMIDTLRSWNMPARYWFLNHIHRNLLNTSKEMRSAMSFIIWTIWIGPSLRTVIVSSTLWVYVQLESEYSELYNTTGQMKIAWDIGFSIMRMFCLVYLTPCFVLSSTSTILKYYNSMFWVFHLILLVLIVGVIIAHKGRFRSPMFENIEVQNLR